MQAFISYSHKDEAQLERLHVHLAQLKRDNLIQSWTDEKIQAGGRFEDQISQSLDNSAFFLGLLSPDYIASNYCYEKEFLRAQELEKERKLIIVPIILEPCEWRNTPFAAFKALPKDGKPITVWSNINTGFLDVIQGLRALIKNQPLDDGFIISGTSAVAGNTFRNYRVKKDFDSIQKIEFAESAFKDIKTRLTAYLQEVIQVDSNIKYRILTDDSKTFEAILVNRNKTKAESTLKVLNDSELHVSGQFTGYRTMIGKNDIAYTFGADSDNQAKGFQMTFDDFDLFWKESALFGSSQNSKVVSSKEMAESIWNDWLESVGIL